MNELPLVSVVVPVYNTEKYLDECINSLIHQTLADIEIIFVDDGSTDTSVDIIKRYQKNDSRIVLLQQNNRFAGAARNNGMDHAAGKYIIFCDSDDYYDTNMLKYMYESAEKEQALITECGLSAFDDITKQILWEMKPEIKGTIQLTDIIDDFYEIEKPWSETKLYLRQFIKDNNLRYQQIKNSNDVLFTRLCTIIAQKINFVPQAFVFYRNNNPTSLQGSWSCDNCCFGQAILGLQSEIKQRNLESPITDSILYQLCENAFYYYFTKVDDVHEEKKLYYYCLDLVNKLKLPMEYRSDNSDLLVYSLMSDYDYESYLYQQCAALKEDCVKLNGEKETLQTENRNLSNTIKRINSSHSYKIAKIIMFIPNQIKRIFHRKTK